MQTTLNYPPSINRYWRKWRNRMVISREGRAFRENVRLLLATGGAGRKPPRDGRLALAMDAFPPDRRRRDLDNIQKPVLDALEHAGVYRDDSQIDLLITRRCEHEKGGRVVVRRRSAVPIVPFKWSCKQAAELRALMPSR
ncbi:MAG: RusA family crossover junction endodeoxyribonuclease [Phycisphaeraceae bacterium]